MTKKKLGLNDTRIEMDENDESKLRYKMEKGEALLAINIRDGDTYLFVPYSEKDEVSGDEYTTGEDFLRLWFGLTVAASKVKHMIQSRTDLSDEEFTELAHAAVFDEDYFAFDGFEWDHEGTVH